MDMLCARIQFNYPRAIFAQFASYHCVQEEIKPECHHFIYLIYKFLRSTDFGAHVCENKNQMNLVA